jgi:hypothetical protein
VHGIDGDGIREKPERFEETRNRALCKRPLGRGGRPRRKAFLRKGKHFWGSRTFLRKGSISEEAGHFPRRKA